jgi:hypothetical protein
VLRTIAALVLAPVAAATLALGAAHAAGDPNAASFVAKTNAERTSRGLHAYSVAADLAAVAVRHSREMADKQSLYHNKNLGTEVTGWQVVGENVGDGGSVDSIHTAFMNSPAHRANILATDYTQIGIGTVTDANGVIWVTEVFRLPSQAPVVAAPVSTRTARTITRPVSRPAPARAVPAKPAVQGARKVAAAPLPLRPAPASLAYALAPDGPAGAFAQAEVYARTMSALAG